MEFPTLPNLMAWSPSPSATYTTGRHDSNTSWPFHPSPDLRGASSTDCADTSQTISKLHDLYMGHEDEKYCGRPPMGVPPSNVNKLKPQRNNFLSQICYLASAGRDLFSQGRGFRFGALQGTDIFGDTPPPNIDKNPYPYSGLSQFLAASHASLWTDQIPDLRIYVVIAL